MKKLLLGVAAIALLGGVPVQAYAGGWKAVAVVDDSDPTKYWKGYGTGYSEEDARQAAIADCENNSGRTCYETRSVPDWWTLGIFNCYGVISTGGSKGGIEGARARAAYNAGHEGGLCNILQIF